MNITILKRSAPSEYEKTDYNLKASNPSLVIELLGKADFIVNTLPLTSETIGYFD